jgi:hypothetical protein
MSFSYFRLGKVYYTAVDNWFLSERQSSIPISKDLYVASVSSDAESDQ